jgi:hypothetical protein
MLFKKQSKRFPIDSILAAFLLLLLAAAVPLVKAINSNNKIHSFPVEIGVSYVISLMSSTFTGWR